MVYAASICVCAACLEPLLVVKYSITVKLLTEHHLEFLNFKRRLQRLARVYTCQNATLLEITCRGSIMADAFINLVEYLRQAHKITNIRCALVVLFNSLVFLCMVCVIMITCLQR